MTGNTGTGNGGPDKVEMDFEIGGAAAEQLKGMAKDAEKLADQQDRLTRNTERYNRVMSSLARQRVQEERRAESDQRRADQQRQRVVSGLSRQRVQEESRAEAQRKRTFASSDAGIAQRRMERVEQEKRVKERMEFLGYGPKERTVEQEAQEQIVRKQRQAQVSARVRELSGEGDEIRTSPLKGVGQELASSLGIMTTRAAAIAAVVQAGRGVLATNAGAARDPYLQRQVADLQGYRKYVPFIGDMMTDATDLGTGRGKMIGEDRLMMDEKSARMQSRLAIWRTRQETDIDAGTAAAVARNAARMNPLPGLPDGARGTASEKQRYEQANRLYEVEKRITQARREQYGVTARIAQTDEAMEAEKVRMTGLIDDRSSLQRRLDSVNGNTALSAADKEVAGQRIAGQQVLKEQEIEEARRAMLGYTQQRQHLGMQNQEALGRVRQAEYGRGEARLADLQQREGEAGAGNNRLYWAGPEGRMRAAYAKSWVDHYGGANAPQDIAAEYQQFFPKEAQALGEQGGGQYADQYRKQGSADYRDELGSVRGQIDKLKQEQQQEGEKIAQTMKDGIAEAFVGVGSALNEILKQMGDDAWKKKVAEETARAFNQGR